MSPSKKLLIIDDDPDFVEGIRAILQTAEYEVGVAYNPKEGMRALETGQYNLLLLDIMMGRGAEGIMIARNVRKNPKLKAMPVLMITGIRAEIAFLFSGHPLQTDPTLVNEVLEKPVEPQLLLEKVSKLLQLSEEGKVHAV